MKTHHLLIAVPLLTLGLVLGGCASSDDGSVGGDESEVVSSAPITLANYLNHPRIKAIRTEVAAINALPLVETANPGCDGTITKYTHGQGLIRKLVESGGEGDGTGELTAYYSEDGTLRFIFMSFLAEASKQEWRLYFDENGTPIWQVTRQAAGTDASGAPDRVPVGDDFFRADTKFIDPEGAFADTGCGGGH